MADRVFQGYRLIEQLMKNLGPLADWTRKFKPGQQHLTLARTDYDAIQRWPRAAHCFEIEVLSTGEVWYRGLELTYDGGPKRYGNVAPVQSDIEAPLAR